MAIDLSADAVRLNTATLTRHDMAGGGSVFFQNAKRLMFERLKVGKAKSLN
jgi:hypothetical protein